MKYTLLVLLSLVVINTALNAQIIYPEEADTTVVEKQEQEPAKKEEAKQQETDIIYQHDGTKMFVHVKKIYLNDLYYALPGDTKVKKMDQRLVHKIEYKTGRIEVLNETAPDVREVNDYRKVKVTDDPEDVEGLIEVAKLEAKAEGSDRGYATPKSLERTATIVLRRKAALVNANIVLITGKKTNVAFGEIPAVTLYGTAYSYR